MNYFLVIGCVLCGWAMLRVMGAERAYMVKELERSIRREARRPPPPPPVVPTAKSPPTAKVKN